MNKIWRKLAEASWPSKIITQYELYTVRDNFGLGGSRANSVEAYYDDCTIDLTYPRYIIWEHNVELAECLKNLGYVENDHATVFQLQISKIDIQNQCTISKNLDNRLEDFFVNNGVGKSRVDIMRRSKLNKVFVTYEKGGVILGANYGAYEGDLAWVYSLVVDPSFRQKGIARMVMKSTIQALEVRGVAQVALSVLPSNHAAIKLYASLGFKEASKYYFLERSDH